MLPVEAPCTFLKKNTFQNATPASDTLWVRDGPESARTWVSKEGSWGVLGGFLGVPSGPWTPLESSEVPGLRLAAPKSLPGAAWETPGSHRGRRKGFTGTSLEPSGRLPGAFGASQKPHGSIPGASPGALKSILGVARRFQDLSTSADGKGMPIELS